MQTVDPRFKGTASKGDPMFAPTGKKAADGYTRSKSERVRPLGRKTEDDPYSREPRLVPLGIV